MFDAKPDSMPLAFGKLHLSVLLAGFTGVFGKLISLNEGLLVWYRLLITALLFGALLALGRRLPRVSLRDAQRIGGEGVLRCRLLDMGLIPNTKVTVQKIAPMGDPMELQLRGYVLTLRKEDASGIEVEVEA